MMLEVAVNTVKPVQFQQPHQSWCNACDIGECDGGGLDTLMQSTT